MGIKSQITGHTQPQLARTRVLCIPVLIVDWKIGMVDSTKSCKEKDARESPMERRG